jgi:hypothetical protein
VPSAGRRAEQRRGRRAERRRGEESREEAGPDPSRANPNRLWTLDSEIYYRCCLRTNDGHKVMVTAAGVLSCSYREHRNFSENPLHVCVLELLYSIPLCSILLYSITQHRF